MKWPARMLERVPVMLNHYSASWPGLSRPSVSFPLKAHKENVNARDNRGHDAGENDSIIS